MNSSFFFIRHACFLLLLVSFTSTANAQTVKEKDKKAIKDFCGCFEIDFDFAETFSPVKDYKFKDRYHADALELIIPLSETENMISMQHLLIVSDSMIVKHWRHDWIYENTDLFTYFKDLEWRTKKMPKDAVKGQWTQNVYQVDDSPRYSASGTWIHADGKHYWESSADAPLPRREHTKRKDYNVLRRTNKHEITSYGHLHEEDNAKVVRDESGKDSILVYEKGWNTYKRVETVRCKAAQDWWEKNQRYWTVVADLWKAQLAEHSTVRIAKTGNIEELHTALSDLGEEATAKSYFNPSEVRSQVSAILTKFVSN